jgi:V/A-type H+-transporting ATPase subunit E
MAGADALTARIVREAEEKAAEIRSKAEADAKKLIEKAEAEAQAMKHDIINKATMKADDSRRRMFTMAELETRKELLQEKQLQIEDAFQGAVEKLGQFDLDAYQSIIWRMLMESVETGEETVIISARDQSRITADFIAKVNEELKKLGKKGELKLSADTEEIGGGFILSSDLTKINNSFHSIIRMQRDEMEPEVAEILFQ